MFLSKYDNCINCVFSHNIALDNKKKHFYYIFIFYKKYLFLSHRNKHKSYQRLII